MKNGLCSKHYPRSLLRETLTTDHGYPLYRRRAVEDAGFSTTIKIHGGIEVDVDNRWVVPYSPLLCKMFNADINVEICNSVKSGCF